MVQEREVLGGLPAGDVGPGIEIGGDSVKKPGPRNLSCSGPGSTGGGETVERLKSKDQGTTPIKPHTYVSLQGDRFLTSSRKRGPRTVSGSSGVPPSNRSRGGPRHPCRAGTRIRGGGTGFLAGHQALACGAALLPRGKGQKGGGRRKAPGPLLPDTGGSAEDTGRGGKGHTSGDGLDFFSPNPGAL